ncbi:MAG: phage tail sheath family protein [Anaerolineales bacterium]|nr:phage tail sheath family protein [Anaerolineales bacterium]
MKASDVSKDNVLADPYEIQLDDLGDGNIIKTATLAQEIADLLDPQKVRAENSVAVKPTFTLPDDPGQVKLCTNFGQFKKYFGDFSDTTTTNQNRLAHAVYGFFQNGGTRCYVARVEENEAYVTNLKKVLEEKFEAIDEIAIVAAPGLTGDEKNGPVLRDAIITHCKATEDRFAIFDSPETVESGGKLDLTLLGPPNEKKFLPDNSDYAAFYFPWIKVFDPVKKTTEPTSDGQIAVPPSGHMAGIYARVDASRGVHKAPANEVVLGALGLQYQLSRNQQNGLNPHGVNCIRDLNGNIRVWGARTIGGDKNGEWRYIPVRRLFLFLRESIDEGLQWTVFEPNEPALWAKITRNVTAFLMNVWRSGALFGATPEQAFYVKCDAETNPPEVRDLGQVVTEIGVAVVKPAEFVIFKISQWAGPSGG